MRILSVAVLGCALLLLTMTGCPTGGGVQAEPELVPVSGTVTLDGEPVAGASVMFGGVSWGTTDDSGKFELMYQGKKPGAPEGEQVVMCEKWVMPDGSVFQSSEDVSPMQAGAANELPAEYGGPDSQLKATVPAGGGTVDLELKSQP